MHITIVYVVFTDKPLTEAPRAVTHGPVLALGTSKPKSKPKADTTIDLDADTNTDGLVLALKTSKPKPKPKTVTIDLDADASAGADADAGVDANTNAMATKKKVDKGKAKAINLLEDLDDSLTPRVRYDFLAILFTDLYQQRSAHMRQKVVEGHKEGHALKVQ